MRYTNILANQKRSTAAWAGCAILMGIANVFLGLSLAIQGANIPVRLVPQGFDEFDGPITVNRTADSDSNYLTTIAIADIQNYTNWTPLTVKRQFARFINRMTPNLYVVAGANLEVNATELSKQQQSQMLFIEKTKINKQTIVIAGTLSTYQGNAKIESIKMQYTIEYVISNGLPRIGAFDAKKMK